MKTIFLEATQGVKGGFNHGKFMVALFTADEWSRYCEMDLAVDNRRHSLLQRCGWTDRHVLVLDLQTGEGAIFAAGFGSPHADLDKHKVWVCPMFEPFLAWLYEYIAMEPEKWFDDLRSFSGLIELPNAEPAIHGSRRPGTTEA